MRLSEFGYRSLVFLVYSVAVGSIVISCRAPKWREFDSTFTVDTVVRSAAETKLISVATFVVRFSDLCDEPTTQGMLLRVFVNKRSRDTIRTTRSVVMFDVETVGDSISVSGKALYRHYASAWTKNVFLKPGDTVYMTFHSGGVCDGYEKYRRFPN